MLVEPTGARFFGTTRGRLVVLLRRGARTADELARTLLVSDSAIRMHLTSLERDGLVRRNGQRRGTGKPAYAYELTPAAERLFPKAYERVLDHLLDVLWQRLPQDTAESIVREAGRRLAADATSGGSPAPAASVGASVGARLERAVAFFGELGGLPEVEEQDGAVVLRSDSCPLVGLVAGHPEVCRLAEALLSELVGAPVQEECVRGATARCAFRMPVVPP